ncbi:hypothetical protein BGZ94_005981 [Podila epigama]|nr:hypothetical protein BGZ94_005981 [Podila epigama]
MELLNSFIEEHEEDFQYTVVVDNAEGFAKDTVYKASGYRAIPCAVMLVDGIVKYVGSPLLTFRSVLEEAVASISSGSPVSKEE